MLFADHYEQGRTRTTPRWLIWSIAVIACILIIQSIFRLPAFRLTNIEIVGLKYLPASEIRTIIDEEMARRRFIIFKNNNYFLLSKEGIVTRLEEAFFLKVNTIDRRLPNTLVIGVDERVSGFVLQTPDQYIQIAPGGEWIGTVDGPHGNQGVIADERTAVGSAIPVGYLASATTVKEGWDEAIQPVALTMFHLTDDDRIMQVSTDRGFRIYFSLEKDLPQQIQRLAIYLQETDLEEPREYIDLRFDESLYIQ